MASRCYQLSHSAPSWPRRATELRNRCIYISGNPSFHLTSPITLVITVAVCTCSQCSFVSAAPRADLVTDKRSLNRSALQRHSLNATSGGAAQAQLSSSGRKQLPMQRKLQTLADRKPQAGAGSIELIFSPIEIQWKDNKLYQ